MSMQARRSIALGSLVAAAISLALTACGGGSGNSEVQASPAPTTTTPPPADLADPLEGEWRTELTCRDSLRAVKRRLSAEQIRHQVGSLRSFFEVWGQEGTKDDPCHGASGTDARIARFGDGYLALCDARTEACDVSATYELVDDHTISVDDREGNLCSSCPVVWEFQLSGDRLKFETGSDAFVLALWEAAPWLRVS